MFINEYEQMVDGADRSIRRSIDFMHMPHCVDDSVAYTVDKITVDHLEQAIEYLHQGKFDEALVEIRVCPDYDGKEKNINAVRLCKYCNMKNVVLTAAVSFTITVLATKALTATASSLMYKKDVDAANANIRKFGMAYVNVAKQKPHSFGEATRLLKKELKK